MRRIDIGKWKPFLVGALFDIHPTKAYKLTNKDLFDGGENPVVVNSSYNNGIGGKTTCKPTERRGTITFSDTVDATTIFYQADDFVGYPHVQGLYQKGEFKGKWTHASLRFFAVAFRKAALTRGFDFGNKFRRDIAVGISVLLPATGKGKPDFAYMEEYIRSREKKINAVLDALEYAESKRNRKSVDATSWRAFRIEMLFEKLDLKRKKGFSKITDVSTEPSKEFDLPLVNAKHGNNGIMFYGRSSDFESAEMTLDIVQNGAIATGDVYAQPQKTGVLWDAYLVRPRYQVTARALLFLSCVVEKSIKQKFGYDNKAVWDKVKNESVFLPSCSDGTPNFAYMDSFMSEKEEHAKRYLNTFMGELKVV